MLLPRSTLTLPGLGSPPVAADLSAIASMHALHWIRSVSVGEYIYSVDIHVNFVEALALEEVLVLTRIQPWPTLFSPNCPQQPSLI